MQDSGSTAPSKNVAKQSASTRVKKQVRNVQGDDSLLFVQ